MGLVRRMGLPTRTVWAWADFQGEFGVFTLLEQTAANSLSEAA